MKEMEDGGERPGLPRMQVSSSSPECSQFKSCWYISGEPYPTAIWLCRLGRWRTWHNWQPWSAQSLCQWSRVRPVAASRTATKPRIAHDRARSGRRSRERDVE